MSPSIDVAVTAAVQESDPNIILKQIFSWDRPDCLGDCCCHLIDKLSISEKKCLDRRPAVNKSGTNSSRNSALKLLVFLDRKPLIADYEELANNTSTCDPQPQEVEHYPATRRYVEFPLHQRIPTSSNGNDKFPTNIWHSVGTCNGLMCVRGPHGSKFEIILWNPLTRRFRRIEPPTPKGNPRLVCTRFFGFGCGSKTNNNYKVVLGEVLPHVCRIHIFSLESNSWSFIQPPKGSQVFKLASCECHGPGFLFDGALHWIGEPDNGRMKIIKFNLDSERFELLSSDSQNVQEECKCEDLFLGSTSDHLCYLVRNNKDRTITIWKKVGRLEHKHGIIDFKSILPEHYNWVQYIYIAQEHEGHVLIQTSNHHTILYDFKLGKIVSLLHGAEEVIVYKESKEPVSSGLASKFTLLPVE